MIIRCVLLVFLLKKKKKIKCFDLSFWIKFMYSHIVNEESSVLIGMIVRNLSIG